MGRLVPNGSGTGFGIVAMFEKDKFHARVAFQKMDEFGSTVTAKPGDTNATRHFE
jgi:hypothetical protein